MMFERNLGYDVSRYWMGDFADKFDKFGDAPIKRNGADVIQLAAFQKAIANFVRITTGKEIPVTYTASPTSYTDGKTVVLSSKIDNKLFDVSVGLALHEGSHILLSDFKLLKSLMEGKALKAKKLSRYDDILKFVDTTTPSGKEYIYPLIRSRIKDVLNIIEDRRIDQYIYTNAPGYRGYYQALYDHYFHAKSIDIALKKSVKKEITWGNYTFHLCNMTNKHIQLDTLPKLRKLYNLIDVHNIARLKSTSDALALALEVCWILRDEMVADLKPTNSNTPKSDDSKEKEEKEEPTSNSGGGSAKQDKQEKNEEKSQSKESSDDSDELTLEEENELRKNLTEAIVKQSDFTNGQIKKGTVSSSDLDQLSAVAQTDLSMVDVNGKGDIVAKNSKQAGGKIKCLVVNELTQQLIHNSIKNPIVESMLHPKKLVTGYQKHGTASYGNSYANSKQAIEEGINLGRRLGKKLKLRNESNELNTTRLRHGRIDKRLIAEIGYGAEAVFSKLYIKTVNPISIHYSIDASGSMGGNKFKSALRSAAAIAKAASMIDGVDVTISFRGTAFVGCTNYPVMLIGYDSTKNPITHLSTAMSHVRPAGSTPEGLCFEAVLDNMRKNIRNKEGIFINISDGEPAFSGGDDLMYISYRDEYAEKHTKKQVDMIRSMGYKTLSYFVSGTKRDTNIASFNTYKDVQAFRNMYGKDAQFVDVNDINQLAATLNEVILRPVYANR